MESYQWIKEFRKRVESIYDKSLTFDQRIEKLKELRKEVSEYYREHSHDSEEQCKAENDFIIKILEYADIKHVPYILFNCIGCLHSTITEIIYNMECDNHAR